MAKTIKQTAIDLLNQFGWKEDHRGWTHPKADGRYVYLGRQSSIRRGTTKAGSLPFNNLVQFEKWLTIIAEKDTPEQVKEDRQKSELTAARKMAHDLVQKLNLDQVTRVIGLINTFNEDMVASYEN